MDSLTHTWHSSLLFSVMWPFRGWQCTVKLIENTGIWIFWIIRIDSKILSRFLNWSISQIFINVCTRRNPILVSPPSEVFHRLIQLFIVQFTTFSWISTKNLFRIWIVRNWSNALIEFHIFDSVFGIDTGYRY